MTLDPTALPNREQFEYWNGPEGEHWVAHEARFDAMLTPFVEPVLDAAAIESGDRVLDVGCGNGATSRAAARRADAGSVVGVDISAAMLARARAHAAEERLTNVEFVHADAQAHPFTAEFDAVVSRFGVMFFADPVAAFTNLAGALPAGGRLAFACWQDLFANEWLSVAGGALIPHVGVPEFPPPDAPGPFAFADPDRVVAVLTDAGFSGIELDDLHEPLLLGGGLHVDEAVAFLADGGMGKRFLEGAEPATVDRALAAVRDAFEPYESPAGVRLGSAAWVVRARRP